MSPCRNECPGMNQSRPVADSGTRRISRAGCAIEASVNPSCAKAIRNWPFTTVVDSFTDVVEMPIDKRISDAELDLMEVLWAADEALTSADVAERVEVRGWSLATIKTMLSRLVVKGAIKHREDGRRFLYSPAINREA